MLLLWWCPFKIQKEKQVGLQFTSTDYLSLLLTPLWIHWTIHLNGLVASYLSNNTSVIKIVLYLFQVKYKPHSTVRNYSAFIFMFLDRGKEERCRLQKMIPNIDPEKSLTICQRQDVNASPSTCVIINAHLARSVKTTCCLSSQDLLIFSVEMATWELVLPEDCVEAHPVDEPLQSSSPQWYERGLKHYIESVGRAVSFPTPSSIPSPRCLLFLPWPPSSTWHLCVLLLGPPFKSWPLPLVSSGLGLAFLI